MAQDSVSRFLISAAILAIEVLRMDRPTTNNPIPEIPRVVVVFQVPEAMR